MLPYDIFSPLQNHCIVNPHCIIGSKTKVVAESSWLTKKELKHLKHAFSCKLLFDRVIPFKMFQGELSFSLPISFLSKKQLLGSKYDLSPIDPSSHAWENDNGRRRHPPPLAVLRTKDFCQCQFCPTTPGKKEVCKYCLIFKNRKCGQRSQHRGKKASPIPGHTCLHFFVRLSVSRWPEGKYWCLSFLFVYGIHLQDLNGKWNIIIKILWNIDILFIYGIILQDLQEMWNFSPLFLWMKWFM